MPQLAESPFSSGRPRVVVTVIIVSLLVFGAAFFAAAALKRIDENSRSVDASRESITVLEALLSDLRDAETGQRGFLLTGQEWYLAPYEKALTHLEKHLARLHQILQDPREREQFTRLTPLIRLKLAELKRTVELRRGSGLAAALPIVLTHEGQRWMNDIRALAGQMEARSRVLLRAQELRLKSSVKSLVTGTVIVAAVLCSVLAVSLYREIRRRVQARSKLEESEAGRQLAVDAASLGTWSWNPVTGELSFSDRCREMFGLSQETALNYDIFDAALHPEDRARTQSAVRRSLDTGEPYDIEYRSVWSDGSSHWLRSKGRPSHYEHGRATRFDGIVIDVNERRLAEEKLKTSEELFRQLAENIQKVFWVIDPRTRQVLYVSPAYKRVWGRPLEGLYANPREKTDAIEEDHRSRVERAFAMAFETGAFDETYTVRRPDGSTSWVWDRGWPIRDESGNVYRVVGLAEDITKRREAEEEIKRLNAELEQRVIERTAELEAANKELEAFSYSVSHDLRAPLRGIDGFARILVEEYGSQLGPKPQRYLQLVRKSATQMGELVDDLLHFSRLSRQELKCEPVNVGSLVRQVWAELAPDRDGREVELSVTDLPPCHAEPAMLKQVWVNLLSNAVKFTRQREHARIEIGFLPQNGQRGPIYFVRDNGVGFDMRYAGKLFGVFQRLHRAEDYDGTGVGLAIVQRILRRHGGDVQATAEPNKGATFWLTLDGTLSAPERAETVHA